MKYDPLHPVASESWLAIDESERIESMIQYHRKARVKLLTSDLSFKSMDERSWRQKHPPHITSANTNSSRSNISPTSTSNAFPKIGPAYANV